MLLHQQVEDIIACNCSEKRQPCLQQSANIVLGIEHLQSLIHATQGPQRDLHMFEEHRVIR